MGIAFVTGTSTGIGMATAVSLARAGHTVYAGMRNPQPKGELQAAATQQNLPIHVVKHDVDADSSTRDAIGQVLADAGRIDVLVNNAGIGTMGLVEENDLIRFSVDDGNKLFWCSALHPGGPARNASAG